MHFFRLTLFLLFFCLIVVPMVEARQVQVFKAAEEDESPMQARSEALNEGFAKAILEEAFVMLPGSLDEVRSESLRLYFMDRAKPFIQGYKVLSSQAMDAGLILTLDVRVNRGGLRKELERLGLFVTSVDEVGADVTWPEDATEDEAALMQRLINMTGVSQIQGETPRVLIERGPETTYRGTIFLAEGERSLVGKDLSAVWVELWAYHFNRKTAEAVAVARDALTVSGWFSPDAALEFDRVLRSWDTAVREVKLVELDMQTSGVGGVWELRPIDRTRFETMLEGFLPQRGLSFQLSQGAN